LVGAFIAGSSADVGARQAAPLILAAARQRQSAVVAAETARVSFASRALGFGSKHDPLQMQSRLVACAAK